MRLVWLANNGIAVTRVSVAGMPNVMPTLMDAVKFIDPLTPTLPRREMEFVGL